MASEARRGCGYRRQGGTYLVRRYIEHGIPPGHFLTAVIEKDLCGASERADDEN